MKYVLFSFDGRINRAQYWQTGILPLSALALLWGLMSGPVLYLFPSVGILVSIGARWSGAEEATGCRLLASPPYPVFGLGFHCRQHQEMPRHRSFRFLDSPLSHPRRCPSRPDRAGRILQLAPRWRSSGPNRYDHAEDVPALLRKGKIALAPLLILGALFVFYRPWGARPGHCGSQALSETLRATLAERDSRPHQKRSAPVRGLLESQPATVVLHQANSEVVEGLLGQVGLLDV